MPALVLLAVLVVLVAAKFGSGGFMSVIAWPTDRVKRIAEAIAVAEGWNVIGSIPRLYHNPGNLKPYGLNTAGPAGIRVFATDQEGWNALYRQVEGMLNGKSSLYPPTMSVLEVAARYVGDSDSVNWARNVATKLGISVNDTFSEIV